MHDGAAVRGCYLGSLGVLPALGDLFGTALGDLEMNDASNAGDHECSPRSCLLTAAPYRSHLWHTRWYRPRPWYGATLHLCFVRSMRSWARVRSSCRRVGFGGAGRRSGVRNRRTSISRRVRNPGSTTPPAW